MNKTKKNRKNNKTFRKLKKGGMEKDDDGHYYPSYIKENKEKMDQRKDTTFKSERRRKSKSQRKAERKLIKDLTRQLRELDINPSPKRTYYETRGNYKHHHTRKSPRITKLPNNDEDSSNEDLSRKRPYTLGGMEGDFNAKEWFKNVLKDSVGPFFEEVRFDIEWKRLNPEEKKAVKHYMQHVLTREEHDEMINSLEEKIKKIEIENRRLREIVLTPTKDNK